MYRCTKCKKEDLNRKEVTLNSTKVYGGVKYQYFHCKKCSNERQRNYRHGKGKEVFARLMKRFLKTPKGKAYRRNKARRRNAKYPEKYTARYLLNYALQTGTLKRPPCTVCGDKKSQGHHTDYSKPLDVVWVCQKHHTEIHHPK